MRKLIYGVNVTMDGCCDHTKSTGSDEIHDYFRELMEETDTVIYGRKTYELMVPFWPDVAHTHSLDKTSNAFADVFSGLTRVVVSRTIKDPADGQTLVIRGDLEEEVLKLKRQPGKSISTGGVELPARLIELGLVDEFHLVIHPVLAGEGRRLFTEMRLPESQGFTLSASYALGNYVALRYDRD